MIIRPLYLEKGDAVGIFAPARSVTPAELKPFMDKMEQVGFEVVTGKHLFDRDRQFAGSVQARLADLHELLLTREVKAIFAARGGYGTAQLLDGVDWEVVRDNPKWLVGFSDLTALHSACHPIMETIHGVMPYSLVMNPPQENRSLELLLNMLKGKGESYNLPHHPLNLNGEASGRVVGGNLSVLYSIAGSRYDLDYDGKILFLEELDEYLYHIDRMVQNLELREVFRKVSGLVVGSFSGMHDNTIPFGRSSYEIIAERAAKYGVPTLFAFPAGHEISNHPLIFGRESTLTVKEVGASLRFAP